ncbi:MAG: 23S rRNA methyltransferase, partial [bacterium]|nr:23S rRNA methyltransferase [bacterium]
MKRKKSSRRWLARNAKDEYIKRSRREGYRSRAAFKLLEIEKKDHLFKHGQHIVDLGASPGGWSQVAQRLIGDKGRVVAMDLLPMQQIQGVEFIQGDFREDEPLTQLRGLLKGDRVDLVLSDMAPNITGIASVDQPRAIYLCELALDFAREQLKPGGTLVVKVFQGEGFDQLLRRTRNSF